ncbi:MAG: hypothetical protein MJ238_05455 [Bacilli bacterium]|nr:hypothetical protein [Bacilli bacterium]
MSKYNTLWEYIKNEGQDTLCLSFSKIEEVLGFPIDHSFLTYKKELLEYGYKINKISLKDKVVYIIKISK